MPVYFLKAKQRYTVGKWKQKEVPVWYTDIYRPVSSTDTEHVYGLPDKIYTVKIGLGVAQSKRNCQLSWRRHQEACLARSVSPRPCISLKQDIISGAFFCKSASKMAMLKQATSVRKSAADTSLCFSGQALLQVPWSATSTLGTGSECKTSSC
jgi:hypothetical protein